MYRTKKLYLMLSNWKKTISKKLNLIKGLVLSPEMLNQSVYLLINQD
nr:MAG TPA: hypothetical protein [Caudoviricetes sp.]